MKAKVLYIIFLFFGALTATGAPSDKYVYICTGPMSKRYHTTRTCKGLRNCSEEITKVTLEKAISMRRSPCKVCCSKSAKNTDSKRGRIKVRLSDGSEKTIYHSAYVRNPYKFAHDYPGSKILVTDRNGKKKWVKAGREEVDGRINKRHWLVITTKQNAN